MREHRLDYVHADYRCSRKLPERPSPFFVFILCNYLTIGFRKQPSILRPAEIFLIFCSEHSSSRMTKIIQHQLSHGFTVYVYVFGFYPERLTNEDTTLQLTSKLTISYVEGNHQSDSVRGADIEGSTG